MKRKKIILAIIIVIAIIVIWNMFTKIKNNKTKKELCGIWGYIRETTYSGESNDRRKEIIISIYEINEDNTFGQYSYFIHHNGTTEEHIQKGEYKISKDYFHGKLYSYVVNFSNGDTIESEVDFSKYSEGFKIDAHALHTTPSPSYKKDDNWLNIYEDIKKHGKNVIYKKYMNYVTAN
jgi:hypothetical protein